MNEKIEILVFIDWANMDVTFNESIEKEGFHFMPHLEHIFYKKACEIVKQNAYNIKKHEIDFNIIETNVRHNMHYIKQTKLKYYEVYKLYEDLDYMMD